MGTLSQIERVIYRHDWQFEGEWASALGELADLTDDEIDGLARSHQRTDTSSACDKYTGTGWITPTSRCLCPGLYDDSQEA